MSLDWCKFCQTFLILKKSLNIFKYPIKSVCAIALAQMFDKLFDKLILGFVKKEHFTYKTRQEEDEYSTF